MQSLAREMKFSESVFVLPPENDGHVRIRIFTPTDEMLFAGHPTLGIGFRARGTAPGRGDPAGDRRRDRAGGARARGRPDRLRPHAPAHPDLEALDDEARLLAALGVERSELPVEHYDNGMYHVYVALGSEEEVAALKPELAALADGPALLGINCFAGSGTHWKTRMFAPGGGVPEDPATGSAAGPLAVHLARHGRLASATRSRSRRARRSAGPRRSTRAPTARRRSSRPSRSAAAPYRRARRVQASLISQRLDLRELDHERAPEEAAVRREVEAVARRVEDEVRVVLADRDRPAGREAATGLAPGAARVVRDHERRAPVDHGDDRRTACSGGDEQRQRQLHLGRLDEGVDEAEHLLVIQVDVEDRSASSARSGCSPTACSGCRPETGRSERPALWAPRRARLPQRAPDAA